MSLMNDKRKKEERRRRRRRRSKTFIFYENSFPCNIFFLHTFAQLFQNEEDFTIQKIICHPSKFIIFVWKMCCFYNVENLKHFSIVINHTF